MVVGLGSPQTLGTSPLYRRNPGGVLDPTHPVFLIPVWHEIARVGGCGFARLGRVVYQQVRQANESDK